MRLWHVDLISKLPRQQLLGQHRECCALRGKGWGKRHATVDYVFRYDPIMLYNYHMLIIEEMEQRGYHVNKLWLDSRYRGKLLNYVPYDTCGKVLAKYPEHDAEYLRECLMNLQRKGIDI